MTDLLKPSAPRATAPAPDDGRSLTVGAVLAGLLAAGSTVILCAVLALAGWFGADAGRYGDTRDAVRVGADAWLLAHGAGLQLGTATISVLPLGLTLGCAAVAHRTGVWAARRSHAADLGAAISAVAIMTVVYGLVALATALLAAHRSAQSSLLLAFVGGSALALLAGGAGLLQGTGHLRGLRRAVPSWVLSVVVGTAAVVLLLLAAGALLLAGSLVMDFGAAATVLSRLHSDDAVGALMYTVVGLGFIPNAVLLSGSYLVGPGFMIGTGTLVSPTAVVLGPVPAFPLLAALPADGVTPSWTTWLVAVPVLVALVGGYLAGRMHPTERYELGAARGLGSGLAASLVFTGAAVLAGGSVGPGRMADVGVQALSLGTAAAVSLAAGGLLGGVVATFVARRRARAELSTSGTGAD